MVKHGKQLTTEEKKEKVLSWLDKNQTTNKEWYSVTSVAQAMHMNHAAVKLALQGLMDDGFMWVKHEPSEPERLVFRLRRDADIN